MRVHEAGPETWAVCPPHSDPCDSVDVQTVLLPSLPSGESQDCCVLVLEPLEEAFCLFVPA